MATDNDNTSQQEGKDAADRENDGAVQAERRHRRPAPSSRPPARRQQAAPAKEQAAVGGAAKSAHVVRAARLRMAREWRERGSFYEALHAYEEILSSYPGTEVAAAAAEELTQMAREQEEQGRFHAALDIFHKLEEHGVDR